MLGPAVGSASNQLGDRLVTRQLRWQGWRVLRIWELDPATNPARCLKRLYQLLR